MKKTILSVALVVALLMTCAVSALAVEEKDSISGDLTVTTFFNEKTDAVSLKSGETLTLKFHNKSNGDQNYQNFVLAIAGAIGDAYTGAAEEVLIIRADNWGWGGGKSDFAAPDGAGNKLAFETDIVWDTWVADMTAGQDVTINLSRDGDTLTYDATIGSHFVKLTATSGVALPETLYVFLTGEQCVLTGISSSKTGAAAADPGTSEPAVSEPGASEPAASEPAKDDVPKTGDESMMGLWIALAVLSAAGAAVVVTKTWVLDRKK